MPGIYCFAPPHLGWLNAQLTKNCGLLPWLFHKNYGFDAVMVTDKGGDFPALNNYVKGLKVHVLKNAEFDTYFDYLDATADKIDVFVLHSPHVIYMPLVERYKELNPAGKVYLELDMNGTWLDGLPLDMPHLKHLLDMCDVIGASCRPIQKAVAEKWHVNVEFLPNGFYNFGNVPMATDFSQKENIILTVGRLGTAQKATEVLVAAFSEITDLLPDWRLELIGSVEPRFAAEYEEVMAEHPDIKSRIIFTGAINDKSELMRHYKRAKIFALTSTFEGAPNVLSEALIAGCYTITSAIDAAEDITANGNCGATFPVNDVDALAQVLYDVCRDEERLKRGSLYASFYGRKYYDYRKIAARLKYLLFGA